MREVLVEVADRRPVRVGELTIGMSSGTLERITDLAVGPDIDAAERRDLDVGDLAK